MSIVTALSAIQNALKSPKDQNAGRYRYRNIEDINQSVKHLAAEHGCAVVYTDRYEGGICVSRCSLVSDDGELSSEGFAAVNTQPKGMSIEQACGAASSYARKYAACGLFAIDSSENDPDRRNATASGPDIRPKDYEVEKDMLMAKKRLWDATVRYSELHGLDAKVTAEELKRRSDWAETTDAMAAIASELEQACMA